MIKNRYVFPVVFLALSIAAASFMLSGCHKASIESKGLYYCPMHPTYTSDRPGDCPICNMKLVKRSAEPVKSQEAAGHKGHEKAQHESSADKAPEDICLEHDCTMNDCPMHVKVMLKPGERISCPICGEFITTDKGKLAAVKTDDRSVSEVHTVNISREKQQLIGVKTEPARRMSLTKTVRASGKIAYDPELVVAQEEFVQALKNEENVKDSPLPDVIERARSMKEASRNKLTLLGMSDDEISDLEKTKKPNTSLYLPAHGDNAWAYIAIYEYEIGLVNIGDAVEIEAVAYPGEVFHGRVISLNPVLDPATRTNQARVEVSNPEGKLKPEMFVSAAIKVDIGEKLAVSENAILDTGLRKIVYLSMPGDVLESREVKTGQKADGYYEIIEGVSEGDIVVTSGNFLVDSEAKLKSASTATSEHKH